MTLKATVASYFIFNSDVCKNKHSCFNCVLGILVSENLEEKSVKASPRIFFLDPIKYYSNEIATVLLACIERDDSGEHLFQFNLSFALLCFFSDREG